MKIMGIELHEYCTNLAPGTGCRFGDQCGSGTNGYCRNDVCHMKKADGQACDGSAASNDEECVGFCAQYASGDYYCCASKFFTITDWCKELSDGTGCQHDSQCKSGWCNNYKCEAKRPDGAACPTDGDNTACLSVRKETKKEEE